MKNLNLAIGVAALVSAAACGGGGEIRQVGTGTATGSPATSAGGGTVAPGGTVAQAGQPGADTVGGVSPQGSAQPQGPAAQPQGSAATPGAVTPTPAASAGPAAAPAGPVTCTNADTSTLPIDETGWVARECNNAGIQGAFYCYDDGVNPSGCTPETAPYVPGSGMCLQGSTTEDPDFVAWGAGIGLSLNDPGEMDPTGAGKGPFDATANGLLGFSILITGDTGGLPIRVQFTKEANPATSPFVQVPGASTTPYEILIADALIPETWDTCVGDDCLADPTSLYDVQIQIAGGEEAADYNFCVESITPITDGSAPAQPAAGGAVAAYGSEQCGDFNTIDIGPYMVQNNAYGNTSHCIQALWDQGSTGGFKLTNVNGNVPAGGAPGSYPSVVYGWHVDGSFHGGGYTSARQLNAITSIPSSGSFTVPGAGRYNMSFDNWIKNAPTSANDQGTLEQMIWLNQRETTPIGSVVDSVDIGGQQWEVWYGPNQGFNTVSYIRATNTTSWNFDLKPFMDDTVQRGYAAAGDYLLGVQAGFEIWEATQNFSVDSFSVSVQ